MQMLMSPSFQSALLYGHLFLVADHLRHVHRMTPKMNLNTTRSKILHIGFTSVDGYQSRFRSTTSHFGFPGQFATSAPNDCKMTFNTKRSKVPHICVTGVPEPRISLHIGLWPAVSALHAILRQVHWITPKGPGTYKESKTPSIY